MTVVDMSITIERPLDEVFAVLTTPEATPAGPLLSAHFGRSFRKDLARLKELMEAGELQAGTRVVG